MCFIELWDLDKKAEGGFKGTTNGDATVKLTDLFDVLTDWEDAYNFKQYLRFVVMLFFAFVFYTVTGNALTAINYLFLSDKDISNL